MKNGFDTALLESGAGIKRGYSFLIQNWGQTVAVLTALIAVLITFTEVGFYDIGTERFTTSLLVMLVCSYVMYFSLEDAGERLGRESDEYRRAEAAWRKECSAIGGSDIPALRSFLSDYRVAELNFRREGFLATAGYSVSEYEKFLADGVADRRAKRAFNRAKRMKPHELSPRSLLASDRRGRSGELYNPERGKIIRLLVGLIPSTVCMIFTVSVMLTAKDGLTVASVIESVVRLLTLPIVGLRGYSSGYAYAKGPLTSWMETKARLLGAFTARGASTAT